jgi:hypothetical protein
MKTLIILTPLMVSICGCSTPYKKTFLSSAAGMAAGAVYGASRPEYQSQNALLYASLGGLLAGGTALLLDADDLHPEKTQRENEKLKAKLDEFQKKLEPQIISQGSNLFGSPLPKEVLSLIEPGEWKRYRMDQWVQDQAQPNIWYRQVEMFEMTPPAAR